MLKLLKRAAGFTVCTALTAALLPYSVSAEAQHLADSGLDYTEYVGTINNPAAGYTNTIWAVCKPGSTPVYSPTAKLVLFFIDIGAFSSGMNGTKNADDTYTAGEDIPLDETFFDSWKQTFENCRKNGCTVAVRFRYDANGTDNPEPASFDALLSHIDQLTEHDFFGQAGEMLMYVESGFVGKWGEQHGGKYTSLEYKAKLLQKLLEAVPAPVPVTVRTPNIFAEWAGIKQSEISDSELVDSLTSSKYCPDIPKYRSRIGLYDDGYMGSDSDLGTYTDRESDTAWLGRQTLTSYFGGEFSGNLEFAQQYETYLPENAIPEMYKTHLSYINANIFQLYKGFTFGADCDVEGTDNSAYYGKTAFDFIRDHLGYRFVLRSSELTPETVQGGTADVRFTVENTGFASIIPPCRSYMILERDGLYICARTDIDCREWLSCTKTENAFSIQLPDDMEAGTWNVYFKADIAHELTPEAPEKGAVRFANNGTWNGVLGANLLGSINVKKADAPTSSGSFFVVGCEDSASSKMYSYRDIINVDGMQSHNSEWTAENVIASSGDGTEMSVRADGKHLYVMAKMPTGAQAPVYNIQLHRAVDNEYFWLYYASNGFIYFNKPSYAGCLCKWQDDTVEYRLPFDIFGIKGGDEIKDIRVFLQDSGNEWKLMGDVSAKEVTVPDTPAVFEVTKNFLIGDANCDKKVTVSDAVAILQFIANKDKYTLSDIGRQNADCYNVGDGITANDALAIQKLDAKVISSLPAN
ncbi:MAG: DUF4832 domain-containing protein [Ruminococcus sp.]|nr:DUF4832 domain-containing protein [Ruminococcus sp.]